MTTNKNDTYIFTKDQEKVYDTLKQGKNTFINGHAGTGKTFVLTKYIDEMREMGKNVVVTAPSGIAAINIGGTTIHRAFKVPVELSKIAKQEKDIKPNKVMKSADIIVIDEISMCSFEVFRYISVEFFKCKDFKKKQMIVIGDFFQLPPVVAKNDLRILRNNFPNYKEGFAFETTEWDRYNFEVINLNEVVRQKDLEYINELNKARVGDTSCLQFFNKNVNFNHASIPVETLRIFPTNKQVEEYNNEQLDLIKEKPKMFKAIVFDSNNELKASDFVVPKELVLKVGCRVMAVVNDKEMMYQNGSLGTVTYIDNSGNFVGVRFDNGCETTIERHDWKIKRPRVEKEINEMGDVVDRIVDETIGLIEQLPLKLAYAVTVHKSQGQTFERMVLDPYCFTNGQLYVALSRCTNIEGLTLTKEIKTSYLTASEDVKEFYKRHNLLGEVGQESSTSEYTYLKIPNKYLKQVEEFLRTLP